MASIWGDTRIDIQIGLPCTDDFYCQIATWVIIVLGLLIFLGILNAIWSEIKKKWTPKHRAICSSMATNSTLNCQRVFAKNSGIQRRGYKVSRPIKREWISLCSSFDTNLTRTILAAANADSSLLCTRHCNHHWNYHIVFSETTHEPIRTNAHLARVEVASNASAASVDRGREAAQLTDSRVTPISSSNWSSSESRCKKASRVIFRSRLIKYQLQNAWNNTFNDNDLNLLTLGRSTIFIDPAWR